ncbi:hypothetical protein A2U01_0072268, partial [Trifolium medium]|nr:hypothetical protein [Trifolium medium]
MVEVPVGICLNLDDAGFLNLVLSLAQCAVAMAQRAVVFWLVLVLCLIVSQRAAKHGTTR